MAVKKKEAKEGYRTVFIPKENRDDTERFLTINGHSILVQTGIPVEVPEAYAQLVERNQRVKEQSEAFILANRTV